MSPGLGRSPETLVEMIAARRSDLQAKAVTGSPARDSWQGTKHRKELSLFKAGLQQQRMLIGAEIHAGAIATLESFLYSEGTVERAMRSQIPNC